MLACGQCGERTRSEARFCPECGAPLRPDAAVQHHSRKTVTVVFSDLVDSTSLGEELDAESLREVMDDYFRVMRAVLEEHGGVVEKFIGDAVMAVFGLPRMHEDDALRAVRAAVAMGDALALLNEDLSRTHGVTLSMRTGVNTGVVVVGDAAGGQRLATGDAVNVAARLEQAAPPNGVMLGPDTFQLVKSFIDAAEARTLTLKGKAGQLDAWLLSSLALDGGHTDSTSHLPLVGRLPELAAIEAALAAARRDGRIESVLVVGEPGLGKTRLVREVMDRVSSGAMVLRATCLPYGATSSRPVADLLCSALDTGDGLDETVLVRLAANAPATERRAITDRLASFLGLSADGFPPDEYLWATAGLLSSMAAQQSLVLVIEDLHWAEESLFDFLGQLRLYPHAPGTLLLGTARPELLDRRSRDATPFGSRIVTLSALSVDESDELVGGVLDSSPLSGDARTLIHDAAQGNPLFLKQALTTWIEEGVLIRSTDGWAVTRPVADVHVPASVRSIFAARVDRLTDDERLVLGAASVAVACCDTRALRFMVPDLDPEVFADCLQNLNHAGLLLRGTLDDLTSAELCFEHASLQEVATEMTLKSDRALLHERLATWLEENAGAADVDGSIGHHLAAAYHYRAQLRHRDPHTLALALRSARLLAAACQRALRIGDRSGAERLTGEVVQLLTACGPELCATDLALMAQTGKLLVTMGSWAEAVAVLSPHVASGHGPLLRDLGIAHCQLHRSEPDSVEYLGGQRLLEMASAPPNRDTDALASLAGTWKGVDDARAQAAYRRCLDLDPSDPYPLGNVVEYEIVAAGDLAVVDGMREQIVQASLRCRSQADSGVNLPWAFFDAGKFALLLGQPHAAVASYAKAVQLTTADQMLATSLRSLERLDASCQGIPGSSWVRQLLTVARVVWFPSSGSIACPGDATPLPGVHDQTKVVVLAGGTHETTATWFEDHRSTLVRGFASFTGVVVSGGTDVGVAGLAGQLGEQYGERMRAIGYLPAGMPEDVTIDRRYDTLRRTAEGTFSVGDSLQAWADLISSGIKPAAVKLLALNGGRIAASEFRVALALGCTVGVVSGSGREADRLLDDRDWMTSPRLRRVELDSQAIAEFLAAPV